jgi:hypothetical protein
MTTENNQGGEYELVDCTILQGSDGALYLMSEDTMRDHRIEPESADTILDILAEQCSVGGFTFESQQPVPSEGTFRLLGEAKFNRPISKIGVPTADGWWDIYL